MNKRLARILVGLYPREWKERYGREFMTLLEEEPEDAWIVFNAVRSACYERLLPTVGSGAIVSTYPQSVKAMAKLPSAYIPIVMSMASLALVVAGILVYGVSELRQTGEGAIAHTWQLLMVVQIPVLLFFVVRWMPRARKRAAPILLLQGLMFVAAYLPVYLLRL